MACLPCYQWSIGIYFVNEIQINKSEICFIVQTSGQPPATISVSSEPRPPMKKLPLHESLASPFNDGDGTDELKKTGVDVDNNATKAGENVYLEILKDPENRES